MPPVEHFVEGYINGAQVGQADIPVDFVYTTSFIDPPQGRHAAQQMMDNGADVIFAAGGLTGNGALSAACRRPAILAIGVDTDQFLTLPEVATCLLSSATKNIVGAVRDSLLRIAAGNFVAGFHVDNAATGGIGLAAFHDKSMRTSRRRSRTCSRRPSPASPTGRSRRVPSSTADDRSHRPAH